MKILSVVGARPNFMKAAPIIRAITEHNKQMLSSSGVCGSLCESIEHILVHTGQHYDEVMSGSFFSDLNLPAPDIHLGAACGSAVAQTADIMTKFEAVLRERKPDVVVVVGDVTSTLACALATAKQTFDSTGSRPMIAHVEAGLRSFDRTMPEEINRLLTDQVADVLFVTESDGIHNLRNEGVPSERIYFVGNTMIDSLLAFKQKAEASSILEELGLKSKDGNQECCSTRNYALLTLHRPSNVDNRRSFVDILAGLGEFGAKWPIIFPIHPRTRKRLEEFAVGNRVLPDAILRSTEWPLGSTARGIILTPPMGYLDFLCLMMHASVVVTDSGGIQEETTCLGVPCVTVRENTERPVTVRIGTNILAGTKREEIKQAIRRQTTAKLSGSVPENWDGKAATRIVDILVRIHNERPFAEADARRGRPHQLIPQVV